MPGKKSTEYLLNQINSGIIVDMDDIFLPDPTEYMLTLLEKYKFSPSAFSDIMSMSRQHLCSFFNIGNKKDKSEPTRIQLIMMLVIIGATIDETQKALKYYILKELYPKSKRDYLILTYLKNNPISADQLPENKKERYSIGKRRLDLLNDLLYENGLQTLDAKEKCNG